MTDDELRALVREAVARHLGRSPAAVTRAPTAHSAAATSPRPHGHPHGPSLPHPSHVLYLTLVNEGDACVIEPTVTCNHCGYCKSHGH